MASKMIRVSTEFAHFIENWAKRNDKSVVQASTELTFEVIPLGLTARNRGKTQKAAEILRF